MTDERATVIGLTGVTGRLGRKVLDRFVAAVTPAVLLARHPDRVDAPADWERRRCDYADPAGAAAALRGVDVLFMVSGAETPDRVDQHVALVDAAVAAGVRHVVLSTAGDWLRPFVMFLRRSRS